MRTLSLDYGSKRIGVAICDELGITAYGVSTIIRRDRKQVLEALEELITQYDVKKIVIGYPIRLDGTRGIQCEKVDKFSGILEAAFSLPVIKWDETLTTKEAEDILFEAKVRRGKRKKVVDQLAATLILRGYLTSLERKENIP
ncbi:MAG: Holliday junction resolvase RuvX [Deltaproteobacteria bacterium]|jgi:putative Holliday junction resolvase|nr:Holliday junction resolvase RuvX [Deltaproteobacteria bacterium]